MRFELARRPWIRWVVVVVLASAVGFTVHDRLGDVEAARAAWTDTRSVMVASHDHRPGDPLTVDEVELPVAAIPTSAVTEVRDGAIVRHRIAAGEIVVSGDLSLGAGPAAAADDDTIVVPLSDPLVTSADVGVAVAVYSEGVVLSGEGEVVHVDGDVVFVAVDPVDAPLVAAAAQSRTASIVFPR